MGDYSVRMRFGIDAEPSAISSQFFGTTAIAGWWSDGVAGAADGVGDRFTVAFPDAPAPFELKVASVEDAAVEWFIEATPEWWAGTTVRLEAGTDPMTGGQALLFTHRGFDPESPVIPIVTPVWAQVMLRLKQVIEQGAADPFFVNAA